MATVEITATYRHERFRFENPDGDVLIAEADFVDGPRPDGIPSAMAIKGPDVGFEPSQTYRLYGRWSTYRNRRSGQEEQQFHFQAAVKAQPHCRAGVIRYIEAAGKGNGIGRAKATKLWDKFGADAVRILREEPGVAAAAITGLSMESAKLTGAELLKQAHIESCSIALMNLLDRRGFPKATFKRCLELWGNQASEMVQRNPYLLMQFGGCGFKGTDAMYLDLGHPPARLKRQALCAWHTLASNSAGNTWFPVEFAVHGIRESVSGADVRPADALELAKRAKVIETIRTNGRDQLVQHGGKLWVAEGKKARNERSVARRLVEAMWEKPRWPNIIDIHDAQPLCTDHQIQRLGKATSRVVGLFGGSPGTGKTFTAAALISAVSRKFGQNQVAVAAPTGKAAVRVTEALQEYGLKLRARTIHSMLRIDAGGVGKDGWSFLHKEGNPLPFRYLIIDESSLIDTDLLSSLLAARAPGTHILFVGDVNQLAPVGHGAPMRDMIAAGLPYGELREIQRNSGRIVHACAQMRDGERFAVSEAVDLEAGENLHALGGSTNEEMLRTLDGVFDYIDALGFDPVWETQVLVPVNAKSELSRQKLNALLQSRLNSQPGVSGVPFRVGDKIVNTQNGFFPAVEVDQSSDDVQINDRGEAYVANGELGKVVMVESNLIVAQLNNPERTIRIPRGKHGDGDTQDSGGSSTGCSWQNGYALSVHRGQGDEWPVVIVVLDEYPGARMVCDRSWVYTAVSRAKQLCLLLGKVETAHRFCRTMKIHQRKTFLSELVKSEVSRMMLLEL